MLEMDCLDYRFADNDKFGAVDNYQKKTSHKIQYLDAAFSITLGNNNFLYNQLEVLIRRRSL